MDYSRYKALEIAKDGRIVTVTINRPEVRNAINHELHEEFGTIFTDLDMDDSCDVIILTGASGAFSGGGDIPWIIEQNGNLPLNTLTTRTGRRIQTALLDLEKPILAKVRGPGNRARVLARPVLRLCLCHSGGGVLRPARRGRARRRGRRLRRVAAAGRVRPRPALPAHRRSHPGQGGRGDRPHHRGGSRRAARRRRRRDGPAHGLRCDPRDPVHEGRDQRRPQGDRAAVLDRAAAFENVTLFTNDNRNAVEAFLTKEKPTFSGS